MYLRAGDVVATLSQFHRSTILLEDTRVADMALAAADALVRAGAWSAGELPLVSAWFQDLADAGYTPPPLAPPEPVPSRCGAAGATAIGSGADQPTCVLQP